MKRESLIGLGLGLLAVVGVFFQRSTEEEERPAPGSPGPVEDTLDVAAVRVEGDAQVPPVASPDSSAAAPVARTAPRSAPDGWRQERGALSGRVLTPEGEPASEADVVLSGRASGWKANEGRFRVTHLLPGRYRVLALARGFLSSPPVEVLVEPGVELEGIELRLRPGLSLRGRVLAAEDGQPLADVVVRAERLGPGVLPRGVGGKGTGTSGADGSFVIRHLEAGKWELSVGNQPERLGVTVEHRVSGPGDPDAELRLAAGSSLHGIVRGAEGALSRRGRINLFRDGRRVATAHVRDGAYRTRGIAPGEEPLEAWVFDGDTHWCWLGAVGPLSAPGPTQRDFELQPPARISGRVLDADWEPVAGVPIEVFGGDFRPRPSGASDADGAFVIDRLPPGTYGLRAHGAGWTATDTMEVRLRMSEQRGEVVLRSRRGARIEVLVPVREERSSLEPWAHDDHLEVSFARASPEGPGLWSHQHWGPTYADTARVRLRAFEPGTYGVFVRLGERVAASTFDAAAGEVIELLVEVAPGARVEGKVVAGRTAAHSVYVSRLPAGEGTEAPVDPQGRFSLVLPPGKYQLRARRDGQRGPPTALTVSDDSPLDVEVRFP